jgi:hypothetical protein
MHRRKRRQLLPVLLQYYEDTLRCGNVFWCKLLAHRPSVSSSVLLNESCPRQCRGQALEQNGGSIPDVATVTTQSVWQLPVMWWYVSVLHLDANTRHSSCDSCMAGNLNHPTAPQGLTMSVRRGDSCCYEDISKGVLLETNYLPGGNVRPFLSLLFFKKLIQAGGGIAFWDT